MKVRRNKARTGKKQQTGGKGWFLLIIWSMPLILLSVALTSYLDWSQIFRQANRFKGHLLGHRYFSVQEIRVIGGEKVSGAEVVDMTGLKAGMNMWKIDPRNIERTVRRHSWAKRVRVRRELPQRLVIQVDEWVAKGIVVLEHLYYVDGEGFVFKRIRKGDKVNFPLITGLQKASIRAGERSSRRKISEALKLSDLVGNEGLRLSEIHFQPRGGVVLYPLAYPVALHMGWGGWREKVQRLKQVFVEWRGRETLLASLDLSFRGQVIARLRKGSYELPGRLGKGSPA
jgi:cell division protein FtsQ